jgi:hypothetical protein
MVQFLLFIIGVKVLSLIIIFCFYEEPESRDIMPAAVLRLAYRKHVSKAFGRNLNCTINANLASLADTFK